MTMRSSAATTLQALELTNGDTLAKVLDQGAAKITARKGQSISALIRDLYWKALARSPSGQEFKLAEELVGNPASKESIADLIWSVTMLPEFQLIY